MRLFSILVMLLLGGCGYSSDHALGSHTQLSTTYSNLSSVINGSITTGTMKNPVAVAVGSQQNKDIYLGNEFFFANVAPPSPNQWIELNAKLQDGKTLYSFYNGTPIRNSAVTIYLNADWHGETGTRVEVANRSDESTVSINPFSNLAYWIKKTNFTTYSTARATVNEGLSLPPCRFERQLCPAHLEFLQSGNNIYATMNGFVRTSPGSPDCTGTIKGFPSCQ